MIKGLGIGEVARVADPFGNLVRLLANPHFPLPPA